MSKIQIKALFFLLFSVVSIFAFDLSVKASVSTSQVFIGDRFIYEIEVTGPQGVKIELPEFVGNLGSFEVKDLQNFREELPGNQTRFVSKAVLNTFVSGDFLIAPQRIEASLESDSLKLQTDPVALRVLNRMAGDEDDILDIEDPLKDPRLPAWIWIILAVFGAVLLIALGWWLRRKFKPELRILRLPPYEEALEALKEMRARNLLQQGNQAEYFFEMGFILRRYLERRFQVDILDATLTELRRRMSHVAGLKENYKESVIRFAEETEPVKFAKFELSPERCEFWNAWMDRLLEETRPLPEEKK